MSRPARKNPDTGSASRLDGHPKNCDGTSLSFPWKSGGGKGVARPGPRPRRDHVSPPPSTAGPGPLRPGRASTPRTVRTEVPHESPRPRIRRSAPDMDSLLASGRVSAIPRCSCWCRSRGVMTWFLPVVAPSPPIRERAPRPGPACASPGREQERKGGFPSWRLSEQRFGDPTDPLDDARMGATTFGSPAIRVGPVALRPSLAAGLPLSCHRWSEEPYRRNRKRQIGPPVARSARAEGER